MRVIFLWIFQFVDFCQIWYEYNYSFLSSCFLFLCLFVCLFFHFFRAHLNAVLNNHIKRTHLFVWNKRHWIDYFISFLFTCSKVIISQIHLVLPWRLPTTQFYYEDDIQFEKQVLPICSGQIHVALTRISFYPCAATSCDSQPCLNGGTCVHSGTDGGYVCRCTPSWFGPRCSQRKLCQYCQQILISYFNGLIIVINEILCDYKV